MKEKVWPNGDNNQMNHYPKTQIVANFAINSELTNKIISIYIVVCET